MPDYVKFGVEHNITRFYETRSLSDQNYMLGNFLNTQGHLVTKTVCLKIFESSSLTIKLTFKDSWRMHNLEIKNVHPPNNFPNPHGYRDTTNYDKSADVKKSIILNKVRF